MRMFALFVLSLLVLSGTAQTALAAPGAEEAKEHYKKGTKLYDLGKYDDAIKEFEAAYEIKDEPVLLYNIAQAHRLANRFPEALKSYRNYLRKTAGKAPNKADVEAKIADMENLIANKPPEPTPAEPVKTEPVAAPPVAPIIVVQAAPAPPPPPPRPGNGKLIGGIVMAVAGLAVVGTGVALGLSASAAASTQSTGAVFDPALDSSGKLNQTLGIALDAGGAVIAVAGAVIAVLGARQNAVAAMQDAKPADKPSVSFVPALGRGYAGAGLRLQF